MNPTTESLFAASEPIYSSDKFEWKGNWGFCELSDLGAFNEAFVVESSKTKRLKRFTLIHTDTNEGETVAWLFESIIVTPSETIQLKITIVND